MNLFQEMEVDYKDFIESANDFMNSCRDFTNNEDTRSIFNMGRRSYKNEIENKIKAKIEEIKNECKYCDFTDEFCQELLQNNNCTQGNTLKVLQSLLEKE